MSIYRKGSKSPSEYEGSSPSGNREEADAMSIIDFDSRKGRIEERKAAVEAAYEVLEESIQALTGSALTIAFSDAWYEWDQEIPDGTRMVFDAELIGTCTDPAVRRLAQAIAELEQAAVEWKSF